MNTVELAKRLLAETPLTELDVSRLLLEAVDYISDLTANRNRTEMMAMLRRLILKGSESLHADESSVTLREAVTASVCARTHLRPTSRRDLRFFARRLLEDERYAQMQLNRITSQHCRQLLDRTFGQKPSLYIKARVILHSVFTYGEQREWCAANPVKCITVPRLSERPIAPLTLPEIARLKRVVTRPAFRNMKLSLILLLYCGIRPAEVARLTTEDICWKDKQVIIHPNTSKTGGGRIVPIRYPLHNLSPQERIIPSDWNRRWRDLRRAAGFRHWRADRCRHTFASYHAAYFRDLSALQVEMGHRDATLLRTRYIAPAKPAVAARFWKTAGL